MPKEKKAKHIAVRFGATEQAALNLLTSSHHTTISEVMRDALLLAARVELAKAEPGE